MGERGTDTVGYRNSCKQDCEPQQAGDLGPVGCHEGKKGGRNQQAAHNSDHDRNIDSGPQWRERIADGLAGRRRDDAFGLPARDIGLKTLSVGSFKHCRTSR